MRATGDRWQNVEYRIVGQGSIQSFKVANMHTVEEDVDERAQFAGLVAEVKAQARVVVLERIDDGAHRGAVGGNGGPVANGGAQRIGKMDQHTRRRFAGIEGI